MLRGFLILHLESAEDNGVGLLGRHIPGSHDESAKRTIPCVPRGTAPCVMSAANEVAVHKFLRRELGYNRIYDAAAGAVEALGFTQSPDLDTILAADEAARIYVLETFQ